MTTSTLSRVERAALARAALAHAELRTGARSVQTVPASGLPAGHPQANQTPRGPVDQSASRIDAVSATLTTVPAEPAAVTPAAVFPATVSPVADVPAPRRTALLTTERPALPVPAALAEVLPDGLRRGTTTAVVGSTSLVLTLLAHACAGGAWVAVVGQPTIGLLAAAQAGVSLDRLALVPRPGPDTVGVLAALVDGLDVVVVGPGVALSEADRRRLSARARERGAVLLSTQAWTGASTVLTVEQAHWTGVGAGDGRLRTHTLRVARTGRGSAAVPHAVEVTLPMGLGVVTSDVRPATADRVSVERAPERALRLVG